MANEFSVRRYEARDREEVVGLWSRVLPHPGAHNDPLASLHRKLAHDDGLLFVAEVGGRVVGTVMGGYDGHRGWVYSVAVEEAYRRRGVGAALMRRVEQALRELGCPKINLQVMPDNAAVVAFYEKLGYAVEPRVSMGKRISPSPAGRGSG